MLEHKYMFSVVPEGIFSSEQLCL